MRNIEEAINQIEKLNSAIIAAERFTNKKVYLKVLSVEYASKDVADYLIKRCKEERIYLILGREYETK